MKTLFAILFLSTISAFAAEISVIDVRRNIPLGDAEESYKDFYLNAGSDDGLKKNLVVTVVRSMAIRDATGAQSFGDIAIPVGQLKIIAVYPKVSVAREYKLLSRDDNAMLEQTGIMNGDIIDTKNSFVARNSQNRKPATPSPLPAITVPAADIKPTLVPLSAEIITTPTSAAAVETTKTAEAPNPVNNTTEAPAAPAATAPTTPSP
jgi:hypothetical protein